ncbi:MAG: hypothetical protein RLZZ612_34 [Pseudomonadota bacterium]|jgi:uncharacterized membrane-anchored protein YhcB (DUF1043 family)
MKLFWQTVAVSVVLLLFALIWELRLTRLQLQSVQEQLQTELLTLKQSLNNHQKASVEAITSAAVPAKEMNDREKAKEEKRRIYQSLNTAKNQLQTAEQQRQSSPGEEPIKTVLAVKETVWKTGDVWTHEQAFLRGLMAPMDAVIEKWKAGDWSASLIPVMDQLQQVLARNNGT